jgi:DnaJ-class molecular chaperone
VLGDGEKRKRYDQLGANWKDGAEFTPPPGWQGGFSQEFDLGDLFGDRGFSGGTRRGGFSDFFEAIFGQMGGGRGTGPAGHARGATRRSQPVETELRLPLEEMHRGTTRKLTLRLDSHQKVVDVRIPPGVRDGSRIRVPGGGVEGGDLYIRLRMEPSRFHVDGDNTEIEVPLSPWEAVLGATVQVPTLDGQTEIRIPPGIGSGQRIRLKGQGLNLRTGGRGDHFVRIRIAVPKDLSAEERRHFEELSRISRFNPRS